MRLIDTDVPDSASRSAAFLIGVGTFALRGRRRPVVSGRESLIGETGEVLADFDGEGWARVQGETWRVKSPSPLKAGAQVRVISIDGLVLRVETHS
ncbi:MAG TPA: NfeD family protein [Burkholderiales bacterium]|nr:NfeD family protein [Burkholderiales bacterium]